MYIKGLDYDDRLMALAFVDVGLYTTSISVFKNLILFADAIKSMQFASLQVSQSWLCVENEELTQIG